MKTSAVLLVSLLIVTTFPIDARYGTLIAAPPEGSGDPGSYGISLQVSQADGRSTWRYTIYKATAKTKDLGHFILDLDTCGSQSPTLANVVSGTVDGMDWSKHLETSEGYVVATVMWRSR